MKILSILTAFLFCVSAQAATRITATIAITNAPIGSTVVNTQTLSFGTLTTRTWTNNVVSAAVQIMATNNIQNSRTNLKTHLELFKPKNYWVIEYGTGTNDVRVSFGTNEFFSVNVTGLWATVTYQTNIIYASDFVLAPPNGSQSNNFLIWQWTSVATNLSKGTQALEFTSFPFTNFPHRFRTQNPPFTNLSVFGGTNRPTEALLTNGALYNVSSSNMVATNLTGSITNALVSNSTNEWGTFTNVVRQNVDLSVVTNQLTLSGILSNNIVTNSPGVNTAWLFASNLYAYAGVVTNVAVTNSPQVNATIGDFTTLRVSNLTVWIGATITNLSSPGTGANSFKVGSSALATGIDSVSVGNNSSALDDGAVALGKDASAQTARSIAIGNSPEASGGVEAIAVGYTALAQAYRSIAIGAEAGASFDNSIAIGAGSIPLEANQIRLGTSAEHVSIPGEIRGVVVTNAIHNGTNIFNGDLSFTRYDITSIANGNNFGLIFGTNYNIVLSGTVTTGPTITGIAGGRNGKVYRVRNELGFTMTLTENTVDPSSGNRFDFLDNADVQVVNGGFCDLIYNSISSKWNICNLYPPVAATTNAFLTVSNSAFYLASINVATNSVGNSNMTVSASGVARMDIFQTNHLTWTNLSFASGTAGKLEFYCYPIGTAYSNDWPTLGGNSFGVRIQTNDFRSVYTTFTNGNCYKVEWEWHGTNVILSTTRFSN